MQADHEADMVLNRVNQFIKQNKLHITICASIMIFLTIFVGTYQWYSNKIANASAKDFYIMLNEPNPNKQIELSESFVNKYKTGAYTGLVSLILIQHDLANENWQGVDMRIKQLTSQSLPPFIKEQAMYLQIKRYLATKQFEHAASVLAKLKAPNQTTALMYKGMIAKGLNQEDDAKKAFAQASQQIDATSSSSPLNQFIWYQLAS